jgi:hypothetical protein
MSQRRRFFAVGAVFMLIAGAMVVLLATRRFESATAADGRRIRVEKTSYGIEHRFTIGKWWVRALKPLLGKRWAARRRSIEMRFTNENPALMVWTGWSGVSKTNPLSVEATIVDEHGTESEMVLSRWNETDYWAHTNRFESASYVGWILRNYPRRSHSLRLRIYDRDRQYRASQAVEIAFANRAPKRYPQWRGERLPILRTNTGFVFALTEIKAQTSAVWQVHFRVTTNGSPDASWQIGSVRACDATGNFITARSNVFAGVRIDPVFRLPGALWPGERAWKFSVEFCRLFDFQPHELWTTPPIPVFPTTASSITNSDVNGHSLVVAGIFEIPQTQFGHTLDRPNGTLKARLANATATTRLMLLDAEDDLGRNVKRELGAVWGPFSEQYDYNLVVLPGAKSVRFTFAVRRSTVVDFDVAAESVVRRTD